MSIDNAPRLGGAGEALTSPGETPDLADPADDAVPPRPPRSKTPLWRLLLRDRMATTAAAILVFVFLVAVFGPWLVGDAATDQNLDQSNLAPFHVANGWMNILGTDPLGRSMLA